MCSILSTKIDVKNFLDLETVGFFKKYFETLLFQDEDNFMKFVSEDIHRCALLTGLNLSIYSPVSLG